MQSAFTNEIKDSVPRASFLFKIANEEVSVDLFAFEGPALTALNPASPFIYIDHLNPRIQNEFGSISNVDLEAQILKTGVISDAIGRYVLEDNGDIKYDENGYPYITVLDGSRRLDCCIRSGKRYPIRVGRFTDEQARMIIKSSIDSQLELSCVELGMHIENLECQYGRVLKTQEIIEILDYSKSRFAIAPAKKANEIRNKYPMVFNIFPVISFVGKNTVKKLADIIRFAEDALLIDKLLDFISSNAFHYNNSDDSILSSSDLVEFDNNKNSIIINALAEKIGYGEKQKKATQSVDLNKHISMLVKNNTKAIKRTNNVTLFEAELTDEERVLTERFMTILTNGKINPDIDIEEHFEYFFRRLD